jgi:hypothetical protein
VFTGLNLRGVQTSSRVNTLLALGMSIVVVAFIAEAIHYVAQVARWRSMAAAILRSNHLRYRPNVPRGIHCRADVHRVRRHLDHVRRS